MRINLRLQSHANEIFQLSINNFNVLMAFGLREMILCGPECTLWNIRDFGCAFNRLMLGCVRKRAENSIFRHLIEWVSDLLLREPTWYYKSQNKVDLIEPSTKQDKAYY